MRHDTAGCPHAWSDIAREMSTNDRGIERGSGGLLGHSRRLHAVERVTFCTIRVRAGCFRRGLCGQEQKREKMGKESD